MRAQEVELQRVIHGGHWSWLRLVSDSILATSPGGIGSCEIDETPPGGGGQPALGVIRSPRWARLGGPLLHGVLCRGEVRATAH